MFSGKTSGYGKIGPEVKKGSSAWRMTKSGSSTLEALAGLYDLCEIDTQFHAEFEDMEDLLAKALGAQKLADIAKSAASRTRSAHRRLAPTLDEAEIELNEGLGRIHQLVAATATATSSMSIGAGDRADNEHEYLQKLLDLLATILNEDENGDGFELVTTEK